MTVLDLGIGMRLLKDDRVEEQTLADMGRCKELHDVFISPLLDWSVSDTKVNVPENKRNEVCWVKKIQSAYHRLVWIP